MILVPATPVATLLRTVAADVVLPRFRFMSAADVAEKSVGELVTVADKEAELAIGAGLTGLLPAARLIGEEDCAGRPELLDSIGDGLVWLVDPIDGTGNFAAGRAPFAIMVALLRDGVTLQSWILDPLTGRLAYAERGAGAFLDEVPVRASADLPPDRALGGILSEAFLPPERQQLGESLRSRVGTVVATQRCAGHEYPLVATGGRDFAIYWRTLAWDHAAGALFLSEAGGCAVYEDGTPYSPASHRRGLILARNPAIANRIRQLLG